MYNVEDTIDGLNGLLEKNYDAANGFKTAAESTDNPRLKMFFENKANQRNIYGHQLITEIKRLGGEPVERGSVAGFMHRAWINVKTAFTSNDEEAILEACETGEKAALEDYDEFLNESTVVNETRKVVENQRNHIAATFGKVKRLEDVYEK